MKYLAVDEDGEEVLFDFYEPFREVDYWESEDGYDYPRIELPKGWIEKITGKKITWDDEPIKIEED